METSGERGPPDWVSLRDEGIRVAVKVRPGASRAGVTGVETDAAGVARLAVQVNAPPVGGKANGAVVKLLARRWKVAAGRISVVSGATARLKVVEIAGGDDETLDKILRIEETGA